MEVNKRIVEVCDWETVEQLTRKGKMADRVIEEIRKRMWNPKTGLLQGVFLAFGGGSIVFDSPLPNVLRMNTYCEEEGGESRFGGGEHAKMVRVLDDLEDAVWLLLADAFEDLCDSDQYCTDEEIRQHTADGTLREFIAGAFARYPSDTVFMTLWFGETVCAKWLGEGVIYIEPDGTDEDALFSECKVTDAPEKIADAIIEVLKEQ